MRKTFGITGLVLGVLLLVGAGVTRWFVAPKVAVLPSDTNTTRVYTGTAASMLNLGAVTSGGQLVLTKVPITVTHHTKVVASDGGNALVSDARIVTAGTKPVAAVDYQYAVDRTSMQQGSGYSDVVKQTGITFNWPIRTQQHNYTGWIPDTQRSATLNYTGTATRGGESVYVYSLRTAPAPITDPQVLRGLPTSIPKATLTALATKLPLTATQRAGLAQLLPSLPDPVKFTYTYQVTATYWVAPKSGIVVDVRQHEVRMLLLQTGSANLPVTPVLDMSFVDTPATLQAAVSDARDKANNIDMVYDTLPLSGLIGGVVLIAVGAGLLFVRRHHGQPPTPTPSEGPRHTPTSVQV